MMKDITFCKGYDCPLKNKCRRYLDYQKLGPDDIVSIFMENPYKDGKCEQLWEVSEPPQG